MLSLKLQEAEVAEIIEVDTYIQIQISAESVVHSRDEREELIAK